MSRWAWLLAVLGTFGVAFAAGVIVLQAPLAERPITAAAVAGVAAAIQAATAVIIVLLTGRLVTAAREADEASTEALGVASEQAGAARDAIAVARDQLGIAERADLHSRRDRQLLAVPLLSATYESHDSFEAESVLTVQVRNDGGSPALGVLIAVGGRETPDDPPDGFEARSARAETLQPGEEKSISISMTAFRVPAFNAEAHERPHGLWSYPFFNIRVEYRGLLGQSVQIEHSWFAGHPVGWPDDVWVQRRVHIDLDADGADPVDLVF